MAYDMFIHLITAAAVALACVAPTALIALAFGIARDGNPLNRDFWS